MELLSCADHGNNHFFSLCNIVPAAPLLLPSVLVCVIIAAIIIRQRALGLRHRPLRLPPGPRGLPIIGHLHMLGTSPHRSLYRLSRTYGDLMYLRFGSVPVVIVSSSATARLILQTHDQTFSSRPQPGVPMQLVGCRDIVFSQPGPYWKRARQIFATHLLRSHGSCRSTFHPLVVEEVRTLVRSIADAEQTFFPVRAKLYMATSEIISRMAVGKRMKELACGSNGDASANLVALLVEAIQLAGEFNIGDFIPWLARMDLQGCERRAKAMKPKLESLWQEIIDGRRSMRRQCAGEGLHSFLDVILSDSEEKETQITDFHIMAILTDVFGGGIDTSAITMEWALSELLSNSSVMKKVQDELKEVVGDSRLVCESDIENLPYLMATVKETLRLHPPAPLLVPHMANRKCSILGYDIPLNTHAYVNVWAIGRDPNTWDKALEFWPDRFLNCTMDVRGQHFELLPFGSGRRICPGLLLGLSNVHIMLANLIQAFDWDTMKKPNMSEKFGIVMTLEEPLVAKAMLKIPRELLNESHDVDA